jgi:hypothetical protein
MMVICFTHPPCPYVYALEAMDKYVSAYPEDCGVSSAGTDGKLPIRREAMSSKGYLARATRPGANMKFELSDSEGSVQGPRFVWGRSCAQDHVRVH